MKENILMKSTAIISFLKATKYYSRIDWADIDWDGLMEMTRAEMPDEFEDDVFMERLAFRSNSLSNRSQEYDKLASTILIALHEKKTAVAYVEVVRQLQDNKDIMGRSRPILGEEFVSFVEENQEKIERILEIERENCFLPTLFGWKTLVRSYLLRSNGGIRERLEHMFLRIALFIHGNDWDRTIACFRDLLRGKYTHATPTLFHAGTRRSQMASCFLGDAEVWTTRGIRKMADVSIGDEVFTHLGNIEKVVQLHKNERGIRKLYRLHSAHGYIATATGDHEFQVLDLTTGVAGWKRLDALTPTDYLMRPHISFQLLSANLDFLVSKQLQQIFRLYPRIAGVLFSHAGEEDMNDIEMPFKEARVYDHMASHLANLGFFRYEARTLHIPDECEIRQISFDLQEHRIEILQWVLKNREKEFLHGMLDVLYDNEKRVFTMTTVEEAECLCMAINVILQDHLPYQVSGCDVVPLDSASRHGIDTACCCLGTRSPDMVYRNNAYYVRFQKKERVVEEASHHLVYTLGVENDHSYVVGGVVAKNCFLMGTEDSVSGIFKTISDSAQISKWAGGIGIHCSNIRASKSYIYGTNGHSNGILPMLRVYNNVSRYIDQCFTPDVMVATERGMRRISTIQAGDLVMNALGELSPVKKILWYEWDGAVVNVNGKRVTPEHNFYFHQSKDKTFEYQSISDATEGDQFVFPVCDSYQYCKDTDDEITEDTLRFLNCMAYQWDIQHNGIMTTWAEEETNIAWITQVLSASLPMESFFIENELVAVRSSIMDAWIESMIPRMAQISREKQDFFLSLGRCRQEEEEEENEWIERMIATVRHSQRAALVSECKIHEESYRGVVYDLEMKGPEASYVTEMGAVHNGGGKRNGAFAMYIEPWHGDVMEFILAKRTTGAEEERARDLFYGLWIPDLFMERVEKDEIWSLFCPASAPGLTDAVGPAFKELYESYEKEKRYTHQLKARELWSEILRSQIETGTPYMLYKDACNYKSNQKNLGTIKSSNLCVAGSTRLMTPDGLFAIKTLAERNVMVWNGEQFAPVMVKKTASNAALMTVIFSNGVRITCTPYHKFYLEGEKTPREASELVAGDSIASYHLPSISAGDAIPSMIRLCMDWIIDRAIHIDQHVMVYSHDRESLMDLLLALQWCGIESRILYQEYRREYELRIARTKWHVVQAVSSGNNRLSDKTLTSVIWEGDEITDVRVVATECVGKQGDTFCFTEPLSGKGLFDGICTGQCTEIIEYSDDNEYACCNLASIALPRFLAVNPRRAILARKTLRIFTKEDCPFCRLLELELTEAGIAFEKLEAVGEEWLEKRKNHAITTVPAVFLDTQFLGGFTDLWKSHLCPILDFKELHRVVHAVVENLNRIIDLNVYPLPETEVSNKRHRPIGIGVQGLADVFGSMRMAFDEENARKLNSEIFEAIYFSAVRASNQLAIKEGPYSSFKGSPMSKGQFHFEMRAPVEKSSSSTKTALSGRHDWEALRNSVMHHGIRNSLLVAPMPTASTSQILGNTECFEPWTSNLFLRRTNAGEFYVANPLLRRDLSALGMWNDQTMNRLILEQGSVAAFDIPFYLKNIYRTVWEIPQRSLIDMAADRQRFIDQSQSLNIFVPEPSLDLLNKIHFYGWKRGLKTGCYYIRSRAPVNSINFTISSKTTPSTTTTQEECLACSA